MKVLGITGGVGSGKSKVLYDIGNICKAYIIETDKLAHELMMPGKIIYKKIVETFGKDILQDKEPYEIDRSKLGAIVFSDKDKLRILDRITHPAVKDEILNQIKEKRESKEYDVFVIEAALLIQDGYKAICDEIWYVYVNDDERIKRLMAARGYTLEKCKSIINSQESFQYYKTNSDQIINNENDFEETHLKLTQMLNNFI